MIVLAIDPGSERSALVTYDVDAGRVLEHAKVANDVALEMVTKARADHLAIEMAESFGAKVWNQVFVTVFWTGRIVQSWARPYTLITRREVKASITGSPRAKDSQIRNALIDRWGGVQAIGTKREPGPLYGITADRWQALAIAVTYAHGPSAGHWRQSA